MESLFVKIFDVDFYMCSPVQNLDITFSQFRGSAVHQVPVIRIFGSTNEGKKICVHIHGIFPYFYIPYDGIEPANGLMYKIASNLDRAINISLGQASSNTQHVYKMTLVSGVPFYGYHSKKHQFFKVYLYNPVFIKRANNLLFNEAVLGKLYQPHETHLNFTLQFMIDYNLHGMSNIILTEVKYRQEVLVDGYNDENTEETLTKVSSCELECDTLGENILNRKEIESGNLAANPGISALWQDEKQRRRNKNEDSQLPHYLSLDKINVPPTESHEIFKRALQDRLAILSEECDKHEFNLSVYPAECPRNKRLMNCSYIDFHSPQNSQSSFLEDSQFDHTIQNENDTLNITLDEDVQDLIDVLKDLEKNAGVEDDSLLSQVSKNEGEDDDHDMTISLEADGNLLDETIKISQLCAEDLENEKSNDISPTVDRNDLERSVKIPQLDGNCQDFETFSPINSVSSMKVNHLRNSSSTDIKSRLANSIYVHTLKSAYVSLEALNQQKNDLELRKKKQNEIKKQGSTNTPGIDPANRQLVVKLKRISNFLMNIHKLKKNNTKHTTSTNSPEKFKNKLLKNEDNHGQFHKFDIQIKRDSNGNPVSVTVVPINSSKWYQQSKIEISDRPSFNTRSKKQSNYKHRIIRKTEELILYQYNYFNRKNTLGDKIEESKTFKLTVDLLNKSHDYFCASFIGERVALKNEFVRKKLLLRNQLKACHDCVVLVKNLHLPQKIRKKRNMPSLTNDFFSSESESEWNQRKIPYIFTKAKLPDVRKSSNDLLRVKKTIQRTRYYRKKTESNNCRKRYVLAKKLCKKSMECLGMLKEGFKPIFRVVPGYKPYVFEDKTSNKNYSNSATVCRAIFAKSSECGGGNTTAFPKKSLVEIIAAQKKNEAQFFDSLNSMTENYSINEVKLLKYNQIDRECQITELVEKRKRILFLDGANDSCSDDENERKSKNRSCKKKKATYSSLPIFKQSAASLAPGNPGPVNDQINFRMRDNDDLKIILPTSKSTICDNIEKIKRKICFESNFQDETLVEEKLACKIKPVKRSEYLEDVDLKIDNSSRMLSYTKKCTSLDNEEESTVHEYVKVENDSDKEHHVQSNENIVGAPQNFLDHDADEEDILSTSALYDIINDYQPQEGTSKCYVNTSPKAVSQSSLSNDFQGSQRTPETSGSDACKNEAFGEDNEDQKENEEVSINKTATQSIQLSGSSSDIFSHEDSEPVEQKSVYPNNLVHYKPLYKPPTRNDIEQSMCNLGIPRIRALEPFYSNSNDLTGKLEVGYNILKIRTLTSIDTPDFESSFEGIDSFRKKNFPKIPDKSNPNLVGNSKYSYCREGNCIITPARKPPTRKEVYKWLKEKSLQTEVTTISKPKKNKIYIISSQDGGSDESLDLSLTLTPLTPKESNESPILSTPESRDGSNMYDSKESSVDSDATLTPKSSRSRDVSPVITRHKRRRKKVNISMILRKSALLSYSSEHSGVISGVTLNNTYGFKNSVQNFQNARASVQHDYLTIISMELHVNTRGDFRPNPQYDAIQAIFYCISNDVEEESSKPRKIEGLFAVSPISNQTKNTKCSSSLDGMGITHDVKYVSSELELFKEFTKFIVDLDPDILIGYEIQMLSWGYLVERCFHLGINIIPELSRVKDKHLKFNENDTGDMRLTGRVVLDFWRLLRHEIALQSYTLQSTVYEILQTRIPKYSFKDLTTWWDHHTYLLRHRTVNYYLTLVRCQLKLLEQLDLVGRTSELARLFGIQFFEVLSRGSQFRVESMMLRLAKPMNYVAVSPSVQQRAKMKAPEHIALVLEPESKLYTDPVIVLDFQSLYPSIIIAYNYCFSTCIGRVERLGKNEPFEFGATNLRISRERLKFFLKKNCLNFSPCGAGFVKKSVRDGIMPRMLREILDTRLMVKKSMKENKDDAVLQKVLHSRQLGLKLIANVTYGYTAANFSGRMPSVELGDSIVSKARETLQRTIAMVDGNEEWGVRVVYGDTDSLFVHCPGKSREEAFSIGEKIVEAVGKENPDPVKLKLEKVYQPCILQTKKRYVGYMYESPDQKEPVYDAKGIETVRRDGCPAVSKMLEKSLRILFETKDVSLVKKYCVKQFSKIILGRLSIQDLTFAKEYRGFTGYKPGACVPSLELAKKWVALDKRSEPRRGERVPYVIVNGPPGVPLIRLVRSPYELLNDPTLRPNALYYITRVIIPPLNRCFNLIGADLNHWFHEMPRKQLQYLPTVNSPAKKTTISQYFVSTLCAVCSAQTQNGLCTDCEKKPQETVVILNEKIRQWEASYSNCKLICSTCTQILEEPHCISLDCPVLYRLHQTSRDLQQAEHIRLLLAQIFDI